MNYKIKNFYLFSLFYIFLWAFFLLTGFNLIGDDFLKTKYNLWICYLSFFFFFLFVSIAIFLWEKRKINQTFFKAILIFIISSLIYSLIPIGYYFPIYNFLLADKSNQTWNIIWLVIKLIIIDTIFSYFTSQYTKFIYSISMKENLADEFINKYCWFLFFRNFKIEKEEDLLFLKNKRNLFILNFLGHQEDTIIQFYEERKMIDKKENSKKTKEVKDIFLEINEKDEIPKDIDIKYEKINENEEAKKILNIYNNSNVDSNKKVFVFYSFDQFSVVKVFGNIPEWFYWNNNKIIIQYIKKIKKVNK